MGNGLRVVCVVGTLLLLLPGAALFLPAIADSLQENEQATVQAEATEATVLSTSASYSVGRTESTATLRVRFRYTADRQTYESTRQMTFTSPGGELPGEVRETYRKNATVTVYYFPNRPSEVFLERTERTRGRSLLDDEITWFETATVAWYGFLVLLVLLGVGVLRVAARGTESGDRGALHRLKGALVVVVSTNVALLLVHVGATLVGDTADYFVVVVGLLAVAELLRYTGPTVLYGRSWSELRSSR